MKGIWYKYSGGLSDQGVVKSLLRYECKRGDSLPAAQTHGPQLGAASIATAVPTRGTIRVNSAMRACSTIRVHGTVRVRGAILGAPLKASGGAAVIRHGVLRRPGTANTRSAEANIAITAIMSPWRGYLFGEGATMLLLGCCLVMPAIAA